MDTSMDNVGGGESSPW